MCLRSTLVRPAIFAIFLRICVTANSGIDLTPSADEFVSEGIKYQKATFRGNKQRIEYCPPPHWSFTGNATTLRLTPPKRPFAEAVVEALHLTASQPLDENALQASKQQFIAGVPSGSQFVTVVAEQRNPLLLDGTPTFEVIVSYETMGQKFLRSALFANVGDTQLTFRLTARKDDFDALHSDFKASMLSWHAIDLKTDTPEGVAAAAK